MAYIIKRNCLEGETQVKGPAVSGRYQITASKLDGRSRVLADWFENLILDAGLVELGYRQCATVCSVGTGNSEPVVTQTALDSLLASTSTVNSQVPNIASTPPYYGFNRKTFRFPLGGVVGTIAEVGVGWGTGLLSRSLIKDSNGAPTTITLLPDEVLDVTYELRLYAPTVDRVESLVINGTTHTVTTRAIGVTDLFWSGYYLDGYIGGQVKATREYFGYFNASYGLVPVTSSLIPGNSEGAFAILTSGLFNDGYTGNKTVTGGQVLGLNDANLTGGIGRVEVRTVNLGVYQMHFSPAIPKTPSHTLRLNIAVSWDRHTPT